MASGTTPQNADTNDGPSNAQSITKVKKTFFVHNKGVQDIQKLLSDAGVYSYAAVCALCLHELFNNKWDMKFNQQCVKKLLTHLDLPQRVESVMLSLLEGQGSQSPDAYIQLLQQEPLLAGKSVLIVQDLILLSVKDGSYDARMRVLIKRVAELLDIPSEIVDFYEESFVQYLMQEREQTEAEKTEAVKRQRSKKVKRFALIGLATVGGGALIGLTGGLAAPLIGAGIGTILGGASVAVLTSTASIAIIGSLFGVAGAGLTGFRMKKRVGEIEEFSFDYLNCNEVTQQLHITIAISGWLSDDLEDNFTRPWKALVISREQYYLRYESKYLLELGKAMDLILNMAITMAAQEALKFTILRGLLAAITWPANLLSLSSIIDNPWGVSCRRSSEVGKQLAEVLLARQQGQRPVTLVGFSLGARVIYYCLREMANRDNCEGIVQDAILLGAPVTGDGKDWTKLMRVVSGRIVNGYCRSDWLLKFLYRKLSVTSEVAGLQPIEIVDRRMCNVDLSEIIQGHGEYPEKIDVVLKSLGIQTYHCQKMKKSVSELPRSSSTTNINTTLASLRPSQSESNITRQLDTFASSSKVAVTKIEDVPISVIEN